MVAYYLPQNRGEIIRRVSEAEPDFGVRHWYFSILTLTFIYLPSPMMMQMVFDRATASVLNVMWGLILTTSAILILALQNFRPDENLFSFVVIVSFTVGLFTIVFGLATVSYALNSYQDIGTKKRVKKVVVDVLLSKKFIICPLLLFLAPVLNILTKEGFFSCEKIFIFLPSVPGDFPAQ